MDTKKLRQKLLELAIRGKLVPQDPNDEPASELLSRIHEEKLAMVERGELKPKDVKNDTVIYFGSDGLPYEKRIDVKGEVKCIADEVPFELPDGWSWARLSDHYLFSNGTSKRSGKEGISTPVLRLADLGETAIALDGVRAVVLTEMERNKYDLEPNDLLFIRVNGSRTRVGSCFVVPSLNDHYAFCDHLIRGKSVTSISSQFIVTVMGVNFIRETIDAGIVCAAGQNTISQSVLKSIIVPVPPLAEQRRIVGALGKYLALVDGIERDQADLDGLLAQLKSKVLDLAVRGELTERDPGDEPASELLARIREEKLAMVERGELKPKDVKNDTVIFTGSDGLRYEKRADGKGEAECIEGEIPFEIPEGWSWCRLLTPVSLDPKNDVDDETPASFLPMAAIEEGFRNKYHPEVRRWKAIKKGFTQFADGDVVFAKISPCFENGKYFIASSLENGVGAGTTELYVLRSPSKGLRRKYLFYFLASNYFTGDAKKTFMGSVGQQRIKKDYLERMLLPVPPLAEQRRIIERIEEVFNLLD